MIKYIAHCKKWRDTINGNTYHSVRITNTKTKEEIKYLLLMVMEINTNHQL